MFRHLPVTSLTDVTHNFEQLQGILSQAPETTFPANPVEGQEFYYSPASGITWHLKYNAASSFAHKWQFVGGAALVAGPAGSMIKKTTVKEPLTGGPSLTVPITGEYELGLQMAVLIAEGGGTEAVGYIREGSTILSTGMFTLAGSSAPEGALQCAFERFSFAAGTELTVAVGLSSAHTTEFAFARLTATPVRVN